MTVKEILEMFYENYAKEEDDQYYKENGQSPPWSLPLPARDILADLFPEGSRYVLDRAAHRIGPESLWVPRKNDWYT